MAAISKALGSSLDNLRKAIIDAEKYLEKSPAALDACVNVAELIGDSDGCDLIFRHTDDGGAIMFLLWSGDTDNAEITPLLDLPVSMRVIAAKYIPELLADADLRTEQLAPEVDNTVEKIRAALKKQ